MTHTSSAHAADVATAVGQRRSHFWSLNRLAKFYFVSIELIACSVTALTVLHDGWHIDSARHFGLLALLAVGYTELADRAGRFRRFLGVEYAWSTNTAVFVFAGTLILPPGYAGLLAMTVFAHVILRVSVKDRKEGSFQLYRICLTAGTMTLAATMTAAVLADTTVPSPRSVSLAVQSVSAMLLFFGLNLLVLIVGVAAETRPQQVGALLPNWEVVGHEVTALVLGLVMAEFVRTDVWLTPLVLALVAAIRRSSLIKELQIAASTDPKTGLLNVSAWRDRALTELEQAVREHGPVAVLMIDLDHFKRINDTYGHLVGDEVLIEVAQTLRQESRDHDILGRFGGEEFVLFMRGPSLRAALAIAERLRTSTAALDLDVPVVVTTSIGLAHAPDPEGVSMAELIHAADLALYEAKANGRDQVHTLNVGATV